MSNDNVITVHSLGEIAELIEEPGVIINIQKGASDEKTLSSEASVGATGTGTSSGI